MSLAGALGGESGEAGSRTWPGLRLRLPASSANLGPGFDTLALALALYLEIDAEPADAFSIRATGRNIDICARLDGNLLLSVYGDTARTYAGREATPLALTMRNGIPLGMGCGSSAASRLAGVALASHFHGLGWSRAQILAEASRLEGHPDNAAACWLGGFVASGWDEPGLPGDPQKGSGSRPAPDPAQPLPTSVAAVSIAPPPDWHALLVLPFVPLATTASRAVLPERYSRRDTVLNLQRVAVLTAAFATGRGDLLRSATADSLHQPYRGAVCPLLPCLLPLAGRGGILSVTLSGAGPAVLLLLESAASLETAKVLVDAQVREQAGGGVDLSVAERIDCRLAVDAAEMETADCTVKGQTA